MRLKRLAGVTAGFLAGLAAGAFLLHLALGRGVMDSVAQQRAIQILSAPASYHGIGDNPVVMAVKKIEPAVVNIDTVGRLHGDDEDANPLALNQEVRGKGSGVILTADGYIVTNNHVVDGASRIRVTLPDGKWYYARLIGRDPQSDLAVVRIDAANLPAADLGDSDRLQVGEWSIAVGNPLGLGSTVTVGVISALNRHNLQIEEGRNLEGAIQTDAAINRGNSGGALANISGQLIGINTAILSSGPNGGSIGLGFALPSNTVRRVAREIISTGHTTTHILRQPWIGVRLDVVPPSAAQTLGIPSDQGAAITQVKPNTPASAAGLQRGDIILSVDGKQIGELSDVRDAITAHRPGDRATIHIMRPSTHETLDLTIHVQERPDMPPA